MRRYVPELKNLDKKYIYEPWKAPLGDLKKARVRMEADWRVEEGGVYPRPMFDFAERRIICLDGMKKAYQVGLYGDHAKAIDGTWRELFNDEVDRSTEGNSFKDVMGNGVGSEEKIRGVLGDGHEIDGAVEGDESGAKEGRGVQGWR